MAVSSESQRHNYFWSRIKDEIGDIKPHLINLLNHQKLTASILITKLDIEEVQKDLEKTIQDQREDINRYAEKHGLESKDLFPGGKDQFSFSILDQLMLSEIAQLVKQSGIKTFLPPTRKERQFQPLDQSTHSYAKAIDDLRKRLQGRYSMIPAADFRTTPIRVEREAGGILVAFVKCCICHHQKEYRIKRIGTNSWQLTNLTKHFDLHYGPSGEPRKKRIKAVRDELNVPASVDPFNEVSTDGDTDMEISVTKEICLDGTDASKSDQRSYDSLMYDDDNIVYESASTTDAREHLSVERPMAYSNDDNEATSYLAGSSVQNLNRERTTRTIIHSVSFVNVADLDVKLDDGGQISLDGTNETSLDDTNGTSSDEVWEVSDDNVADITGAVSSELEQRNISAGQLDLLSEDTAQTNDLIHDDIYEALKDAPILKVLVQLHLRNKLVKSNGRRFSELEKDICAYQYLNSGRGHYIFWERNMINISIKSLQSHIKAHTFEITEGIVNVAGLKDYLVKNNFPMAVLLCEDGTRISPAVEYDYRTDSLRGLVAPLDRTTGLPEQNRFLASSPVKMANDIKQHRVANYAYVQLAVPMCKEAAPFVLFHMSTDSRFTAEDVLNRWKLEEDLLSSENIRVIGYAADGDGRVLKGQKIRARFNRKGSSKIGSWYITNDDPEDAVPIQDQTHILNKMKNRFAHNGANLDLKIGDFTITTDHLKALIKKLGKDKVNLTLADIVTKDRMKFGPTLKFINNETIQSLEANIPGSTGTVLYLKTMRRLYRSFMEEDLTLLERVFEIWVANFTIRGWKNWCVEENAKAKKNKLKGTALKCFITSNANIGIELNAHSLISFIERCRNQNDPSQCMVNLLSSQHCEGLFRSLRSSSTTNQTVVNFSAKELTSKLQSTQFKIDVMYRQKENFDFPAIERMNKRKTPDSLPTLEQIQSTVLNAQVVAREELAKVSIKNINLEPALNAHQIGNMSYVHDSEEEESGEEEEESDFETEELELSRDNISDDVTESRCEFEFVSVDDDSNADVNEHINSPADPAEVFDLDEIFPECEGTLNLKSSTSGSRHTFNIRERNGTIKVIKKQTLLWMMTDGRYRISTDRLKRFQQREFI